MNFRATIISLEVAVDTTRYGVTDVKNEVVPGDGTETAWNPIVFKDEC